MARTRAAWWVSAVAVCVLAYLTLMTYADVFGPGALGATPSRCFSWRASPSARAAASAFAGLDAFFFHALSADPGERPASATALAASLSDAITSAPGSMPR